MARTLKAIDLYSGVGGWSLGLRLAGIEVVASYDQWGPANETNFKNNRHQTQTIDIRRLDFSDLPKGIDIVVGSPPCTQFSFSNRGGNGDLKDGLEDIIQFLRVVEFVKPRFWAMENVPRVAKIIEKEIKRGGKLHRFASLGIGTHVVNMEDFGVPQRRKRCIAGNFDYERLLKNASTARPITLGSVVKSLSGDPIIDPTYSLSLVRSKLLDHDPEEPLNEEEIRINRAAKTTHPVYNSMPFPDPLNRSVRTITATCTRVSRESVIIEIPRKPNSFRRLTVRERACLQGFPITFQFYGSSYAQKLRMVGNAIPPIFAYYLAHTFRNTTPTKVPALSTKIRQLTQPTPAPILTTVDRPGARYPVNRKFRLAIPSLRLKSGVRFDLENYFVGSDARWKVTFWFGDSKRINTIELGQRLLRKLYGGMTTSTAKSVANSTASLSTFIRSADVANLQTLWAHRGPGRTRPFMMLDKLSDVGNELSALLAKQSNKAEDSLRAGLRLELGSNYLDIPGIPKLLRNAPLILSGLIIGSIANDELHRHTLLNYPRASIR